MQCYLIKNTLLQLLHAVFSFLQFCWLDKAFVDYLVLIFFNPLSADVEYTPHETVDASDSCNSGHSENYDKNFDIFVQEFDIFYKTVSL